MAAQTFLRTVSKVVGGEVVDDAVAFFQAFEGMEEGFRQRAARVNELLADDGTAFVLVASPRRDTVDEAHFFAERLAEAGIAVRGLIVNRVHPPSGFGRAGPAEADAAPRAAALAGTGGTTSAASTATSPTSRPSPAASSPPRRAGRGRGARPGGVGAVPAHRRARPRRAGRGGRPRLPASGGSSAGG